MQKGEPDWWMDALVHFADDPIMGECITTYGPGLRAVVICSTRLFDQSLVNRSVSLRLKAFGTDLKQWSEPFHDNTFVNSAKRRLLLAALHDPREGYILGLANDADNLLNFPYTESSELEIRKHLIQFKGVGMDSRNGDDLYCFFPTFTVQKTLVWSMESNTVS